MSVVEEEFEHRGALPPYVGFVLVNALYNIRSVRDDRNSNQNISGSADMKSIPKLSGERL